MSNTNTYLFSNQDLKRLILPLLVEQLLAVLVGLMDSIRLGVFGVWMAMILDWCVRSAFFIVHYLRGKWMEKGMAL